MEQYNDLVREARQLERELDAAEWKVMHREEMYNQREQLIRDLQTAAMNASAKSETGPTKERLLLEKIAKANVIFPSMCANNSEAYSINHELEAYKNAAPSTHQTDQAAGDQKQSVAATPNTADLVKRLRGAATRVSSMFAGRLMEEAADALEGKFERDGT
jgi:hypothetical protein